MEMPISETYEQELLYMPYKKSLARVLDYVLSHTSDDVDILDLMCGPGFLVGQIASQRRGYVLGVDIDREYIEHARRKYRNKGYFEVADVLSGHFEKANIVLCTGSLHHIPYERQEEVIAKIAELTDIGGFSIISDCYIDDYSSETERKIAAARLGYEYLAETIKNGAPDEVVKATADILTNDVMMQEFKTSLKKRTPQFKKHFRVVHTEKTWPNTETEYGDYINVLRR